MSRIALHFEIKAGGGVGKSGPGDTLRLVHALRACPVNRILTVRGLRFLEGLIDGSVDVVELNETEPSAEPGEVSDDILTPILAGNCVPGDEVVHAFIGNESPHPFSGSHRRPGGSQFLRRRIDSSDPAKSFMFHSRWMPVATGRPRGKTLAVTIRAERNSPELNTPRWLPDLARRIAAERGWRLLWLGGADAPPRDVVPRQDEECLFHAGKSLRTQLLEVRRRACAGVGVNSGGLDIVAASGLPILRIGEYQNQWAEQAEPPLSWGERYNSFLSIATNIGLASTRRDASQVGEGVVSTSLGTFLDVVDRLSKPAHVILPPNEPLRVDHLGETLRRWEIAWPV